MFILPLKILKKVNLRINPDRSSFGRNWKMFPNKEYASSLIAAALNSEKPIMIARIGANELACMCNYLGVNDADFLKNYKGYINNQSPAWWWDQNTIEQLQKGAGFFPGTIDKIERFCKLMISDLNNVDILGSWLKEERFFNDNLSKAKKVMLEDLEPFFTQNPWTVSLKGKKVLVVHPFEESIKKQYLLRNKLFDNDLLPDFELLTLKAVQTIAGEATSFTDWFEALDYMKEEISAKDFDICILGCGAYGFPLASYVKSLGKKAIHLGGVTQLLFGIKGKRWENFIVYPYGNLYNEFWVRPGKSERPGNAQVVEGACYW